MITSTELSKYRQQLRQLTDAIEKLAFQCTYTDPLIRGTPGKVFRSCGQKNCKCAGEPAEKHGPYLVIQIYQDKKQRQVALKQDQTELWQEAINYQKQMKTLNILKKTCSELTATVHKIINQRLKEFP